MAGPNEFESAFERMQQGPAAAVAVSDDSMLIANIRAIAAIATTRRLVSIGNKEFAPAGGLMGYGIDFFATYRRAAVFVNRSSRGQTRGLAGRAGDKFDLVINAETARMLSLTVPDKLLARADEVIE